METKGNVNIVFHRVLENGEHPRSPYDLSRNFILSLVDKILPLLSEKEFRLRLFFDDGHLSHSEISQELKRNYGLDVVLGIVTDDVGGSGYLASEQLVSLFQSGISIASHGVSHAALGRYENGKVKDSPAGGMYHLMPRGKENILTENEIVYQTVESRKFFEKLGIPVSEFVYPYGIYNDQTKNIVSKAGYVRAYSCDFNIENEKSDALSIPRLVIDSSLPVDGWVDKIGDLVG